MELLILIPIVIYVLIRDSIQRKRAHEESMRALPQYLRSLEEKKKRQLEIRDNERKMILGDRTKR